MGLIIKDEITKLMKGYPTVSDKYNVAGGILEGDTAVEFGDLVQFGSTTGYYAAITGAITVDKVAGFVVATNVKLVDTWGEGSSQDAKTLPGEAFNLLIDGFIAVKLANTAKVADIKPNGPVAITLASGALTTPQAAGTANLTNCVFTGIYQAYGEDEYLAEIRVK